MPLGRTVCPSDGCGLPSSRCASDASCVPPAGRLPHCSLVKLRVTTPSLSVTCWPLLTLQPSAEVVCLVCHLLASCHTAAWPSSSSCPAFHCPVGPQVGRQVEPGPVHVIHRGSIQFNPALQERGILSPTSAVKSSYCFHMRHEQLFISWQMKEWVVCIQGNHGDRYAEEICGTRRCAPIGSWTHSVLLFTEQGVSHPGVDTGCSGSGWGSWPSPASPGWWVSAVVTVHMWPPMRPSRSYESGR